MILHIIGFGYWEIKIILYGDISLFFYVTWKFSLLFSYLKYQSLPPIFINCLWGSKTFHQPYAKILGFSQTLYGYTSSVLLALSCGRIPKFVCLLLILQCIKPAAKSLSLVFSKLCYCSSFFFLCPADTGLLSACAS